MNTHFQKDTRFSLFQCPAETSSSFVGEVLTKFRIVERTYRHRQVINRDIPRRVMNRLKVELPE